MPYCEYTGLKMGAETRKRLGKLWKEGKVKGDFEKYYLEFKEETEPISKSKGGK